MRLNNVIVILFFMLNTSLCSSHNLNNIAILNNVGTSDNDFFLTYPNGSKKYEIINKLYRYSHNLYIEKIKYLIGNKSLIVIQGIKPEGYSLGRFMRNLEHDVLFSDIRWIDAKMVNKDTKFNIQITLTTK